MADGILDKVTALLPTTRGVKKAAKSTLADRKKQLADVKKSLSRLVKDVERLTAMAALDRQPGVAIGECSVEPLPDRFHHRFRRLPGDRGHQ